MATWKVVALAEIVPLDRLREVQWIVMFNEVLPTRSSHVSSVVLDGPLYLTTWASRHTTSALMMC